MVKIICWNIAHRHAAWRLLARCDVDIALLQEAVLPPDDVAGRVEVDQAPFHDASGHRISRAAVVKLSYRVQVEWLEPVPLAIAGSGDFAVSKAGSIAAAIVTGPGVRPFVAASICAAYEKPHRSTGKMSWNIVDASVHRIISDLSLLIGKQEGHRIVAAGDLTVWHGYGRNNYWKRRYDTVFDRMEAIGLPFVGPQFPHGRQADPWPSWLPEDSLNAPTFCNIGASPAEAMSAKSLSGNAMWLLQIFYGKAVRLIPRGLTSKYQRGVGVWKGWRIDNCLSARLSVIGLN